MDAAYNKNARHTCDGHFPLIQQTFHKVCLVAQMLRAGADIVQEQKARFSYALLSLYPINSQNWAKTDMEKQGLEAVAKEPDRNFYGEETWATSAISPPPMRTRR